MSDPPQVNRLERDTLLKIAVDAMLVPLKAGEILRVDGSQHSPALRQSVATFVTLLLNGNLHGCCGSVLPQESLIENVAHSAYAAAFCDGRFEPLEAHELPRLELHISLLSHPQPMHFDDEVDLLNQLRPEVDGLILNFQSHQGVFLPAVWEHIPDRHAFLNQLKIKAGLAPAFWSSAIRVQRFTVEEIEGRAADYLPSRQTSLRE
ncbi:MAG: AmmeMemoRadiSam system protein A [Rhodopirellula sp.]|nr:AmmeMemoRadiSam system protein A [Rhodopirellula sp.]